MVCGKDDDGDDNFDDVGDVVFKDDDDISDDFEVNDDDMGDTGDETVEVLDELFDVGISAEGLNTDKGNDDKDEGCLRCGIWTGTSDTGLRTEDLFNN